MSLAAKRISEDFDSWEFDVRTRAAKEAAQDYVFDNDVAMTVWPAKDKLKQLEREWLHWSFDIDFKKPAGLRSEAKKLDEQDHKILKNRIEALRHIVAMDQKAWSVVVAGLEGYNKELTKDKTARSAFLALSSIHKKSSQVHALTAATRYQAVKFTTLDVKSVTKFLEAHRQAVIDCQSVMGKDGEWSDAAVKRNLLQQLPHEFGTIVSKHFLETDPDKSSYEILVAEIKAHISLNFYVEKYGANGGESANAASQESSSSSNGRGGRSGRGGRGKGRGGPGSSERKCYHCASADHIVRNCQAEGAEKARTDYQAKKAKETSAESTTTGSAKPKRTALMAFIEEGEDHVVPPTPEAAMLLRSNRSEEWFMDSEWQEESHLLGLPHELVRHILKRCDPRTLLDVRIVCRCLEEHVREMLTSSSFERHVSHLFISSVVLHYTPTSYMEHILTNLNAYTVAFVYKFKTRATWRILTRACFCPSPVTGYGIKLARAYHTYSCTNCKADEWRDYSGGHHFTTLPPASLRDGLVRAFGPRLLLKLYLRLFRQLENAMTSSVSRQLACQARLQSYEAAFEIESRGDHELRLGETAREISTALGTHGPHRLWNFVCTYHPYEEQWHCYEEEEDDESDSWNERDDWE